MPDIAAPWMKWRWPRKKIAIIGTISHMLAAIVMCHDASFGLMKARRPSDNVFTGSECKKISGSRKSFQCCTNEKIAMAYLPTPAARVGSEVEVLVRGRPYRAEQVKLPFYRRAR